MAFRPNRPERGHCKEEKHEVDFYENAAVATTRLSIEAKSHVRALITLITLIGICRCRIRRRSCVLG